MKLAIRVLALSASLFALADSASALTVGGPTQGLWWNPAESGRGYQIDLQGDTMIVTTFTIELDTGLSHLLQSALPLAVTDPRQHSSS